jgi:hypothetical protein
MVEEYSRQYEIRNLDRFKGILKGEGYDLKSCEGRDDIYGRDAVELGSIGNIRSGTKWCVVTAFSETDAGKGLQKFLAEFKD